MPLPIVRVAGRRLMQLAPVLLAACAVADSRAAHIAQTRMLGMSEVDLESCLGAPDQHASFGDVDVLTYYTTSSSSTSYSIPVIGGLGFSNGGNCHATFDLKDQHVVRILYSGEKNALAATDAYCAPILRTCLDQLGETAASQTANPAAAPRPMPTAGAEPAAPATSP